MSERVPELVDLEPVEDSSRDRLRQVAGRRPGVGERVTADEGGSLEHEVVELASLDPRRSGGADECPRPQPIAP